MSRRHTLRHARRGLSDESRRHTAQAAQVLFRGMVMSDEPPLKRYRTIVKRLREYLDFVNTDPRFSTTIHSEGDGVAISYYQGAIK